MHSRQIPESTVPAKSTADRGEQALEEQVVTGLNLFLRLKSPTQMPALLATIGSQKQAVNDALAGLHYVHFARFLPTPDGSTLLVITEFDGDLKSYIMDFVAVLGDVFTAILEFVQDAPRLPVQKYPQDFWNFIQKNNIAQAQPWSAYPLMTVIDIQGPRRSIPPPVAQPAALPIDLDDVQGNVLRGYRVHFARHFALAVGDAPGARRFIAGLVCGDEGKSPQITSAADWQERPAYFLNVGFTASGLKALGVADATLQQFPIAFQQGPADPLRAAAIGDTGESDPTNWVLGHPAQRVDMLLSLFADERHGSEFESKSAQLRNLFAQFGLKEVSCHDAAALPDGTVHFGYRDSISQPRIAGVPLKGAPDMQPAAGAGEFLLGKNYVNQYGGNFIGDLPHALCDNATYAAVRMLRQDVQAFETLLARVGERHNMDPELVAAKLMGRWRNGVPLTLSPQSQDENTPTSHLNNFDYAPSAAHPTFHDDFDGLRCPIGSHIRRLNPRGSLVTGKPHSRRIIRRGMPYGPAYDPSQPDAVERGLFGLFICGDLEMQYEFLVSVWANKDIATTGLRDTQDPILGPQSAQGGRFVIRTHDSRDPIGIDVPRLVTTRGSLYTFIPGIGGLRYLASLVD